VDLFSRIIVGFGAFLIVPGVIYGVVTYEWEGTTLMLIVAGGALLVGAYLISAVQRARTALTARAGEAPGGADAEPHVGPTIWPLVFALSTIGLVVGAVGPRWALVGGGLLFVAAGVGWILDIRQQWRHHDGGEPHEETHDLTGEPHHG
jgi:hypothetical protein